MAEKVAQRAYPTTQILKQTKKLSGNFVRTLENNQRLTVMKEMVNQKATLKWQEGFVALLLASGLTPLPTSAPAMLLKMSVCILSMESCSLVPKSTADLSLKESYLETCEERT